MVYKMLAQKKVFLKIGPKGQITIPIKLRNQWQTNIVAIEVSENGEATLSPAENIEGSLHAYKKDIDTPFEEVRNIAWKKSLKSRVGE